MTGNTTLCYTVAHVYQSFSLEREHLIVFVLWLMLDAHFHSPDFPEQSEDFSQ